MSHFYSNHRKHEVAQVGNYTVPGDLDINGFEADRPGYTRDDNFRLDRVDAAHALVKTALQRDTAYHPKGMGAAWIKSRVEERLGYFITDGEFIMAMIGAGFKYQRSEKHCLFYIRPDSISFLRKENRPN